MSTFDFSTLSPDLMLDALFHYGFDVSSGLLQLNSFENRVCQFRDDDNKRWVVKFYRPQRWSLEQLNEEHQFVRELADIEVPVAEAVERDGQQVLSYGGFYLSVFPSRGGRTLEPDNENQMLQLGRFLGMLHQVGAARPFLHRPTINHQTFLLDSQQSLLQSGLIPPSLEKDYQAMMQQVCDKVGPLFKPEKIRRIHGDCHIGNLLWHDDRALLLDFDDSRNGPAVQDLWLLLSGDRAEQTYQLSLLLEEYEQYCDFDHKELRLIEPLRAMRILSYMAWIAKRWSDPAFPKNFPWFSTDQYWQQQLRALDEQLKFCDQSPLSLMPQW